MNQNLIEQLKQGVVTIKFVKRDGSLRTMKATLCDDLIGISTFSIKKQSGDVQSVWDVEKQEWRSFKWSSLQN
jgi:hypothetical protein